MWTFEPGVALKILNDFVRDAGVTVVYGERLDLSGGVRKLKLTASASFPPLAEVVPAGTSKA